MCHDHFLFQVVIEISRQQKTLVVRLFCTSHFANCDERQKMSIFELILTSMAGLKKVTRDKYIPECESSCLRELQISNFSGAGEHAQ